MNNENYLNGLGQDFCLHCKKHRTNEGHDGCYKIDESYEVYAKQVSLVPRYKWRAKKKLKRLRKEILANKHIS